MIKRLEHLSYEEKLRLFILEKRRLRNELMNVYKYLLGRSKENGTRLFSVVWMIGHVKLGTRYRKFKHNKTLFFVRTIREVVGSPSLEISKTWLDNALTMLNVLVYSSLSSGLNQMVSRGVFNHNHTMNLWSPSWSPLLVDIFCSINNVFQIVSLLKTLQKINCHRH